MDVTCPSCGTEQPAVSRFCSACGTSLRRACPSCGTEQSAIAAFCSACGVALQGAVARAGSVEAHEERRVVTVLFADLSGSTALGERLDPEDVREIQGELFEFLNAQVERHGGMTEKFVGDAVLAVFGAPQAHEDDPERAVRTALALRDAFPVFADRVHARHGAVVGLRIGVNTGDVVAGREAAARGELVVSGDPVNTAARLQQHAEPGQVVVGARTRVAAQRAIEFEGPVSVAAKGKDEPIEAWIAVELVADPARRGLEGVSAPLIGRDTELGILTAVAARVEREDVPQLVTLFGPAGVGKSRLLRELVASLGPDTRFLEGRCLPYGDGITYWPLAEVAKGHAGVLETDSAGVALEKLRRAVESVVPADQAAAVLEAAAWTIGLSLPEATPTVFVSSDVRGRLYDAWARYLGGLGRERLTVLAIEDIHWASSALLDVLEHVTDTISASRVLIVCTARPELLDARATWGAGKQNATALNLQPLGTEDALRLVDALLTVDEVGEAARMRIIDRAEGNPFFVEEILGMLIDRGALVRRNGSWAATASLVDIPLPDSVHGVLAARMDLLDAPAREALRRCAVVGRVFWPSAVGVDEDVVAALARRGLVSEQPTSVVAGTREFAFKHALTRDVAYESLPRQERRVLHRRVGEWVERFAPDRAVETAEIAAYHYVEALRYGERDPDLQSRAFDLVAVAGEAALNRSALMSADLLFAQALELATTAAARARILLDVAQIAIGQARYVDALAVLSEARGLARGEGSAMLEADALSWHTRACWLAGLWDEAVASAEDAVALLDGLPESPELARALARRSQIEMLRGLPIAEQHSREAIDVAQRVGERAAEVNARINLFTVAALQGMQPTRSELVEIVEAAAAVGAHEEGIRAVVNYLWSAYVYLPIGELEEAVDALLDRVVVAQFGSLGDYLRMSRAKFFWIPSGRWELVDPVVAGTESVTSGSTRLLWLEIAAGMHLRRGELGAADLLLTDFENVAFASNEPQRIVAMASVVLPRAAIDSDRAMLRRVGSRMLELPVRWEHYATPAIPRALARGGEIDLLEGFTAGIAPGAEVPLLRTASLAALGSIALARGEASAAVDCFRELVRLEQSRDASYSAACSELDLALALQAAGDERGADEARARADAVLAPIGCVNPV